MVRTKGRHMQQTNKMNKYAVARRPGDPGVAEGIGGMRGQGTEQDPPHIPLRSEIMAAIHDLKQFLEPRLDSGLTFKKSLTKSQPRKQTLHVYNPRPRHWRSKCSS
ncbi:hypothetical protein NDU88_006853 [Pleurodeles waltl]|uniref:Uncharacterized protein n=1 Tax=Pleurodeles waltl TaxID=8319 RepID=A0AAV7TZK3_PLEWA|nr:hypothetical protein NDU88_006853 [Pleurodeles waltl]